MPITAKVPSCESIGLFFYRHFKGLIPETIPDLWFGIEGQPIRWELPIGVIADALGKKDEVLEITVSMESFPANKVLRCQSQEIAISYFTNSYKEGLFVAQNNMQLTRKHPGIQTKTKEFYQERNLEEYTRVASIRMSSFDSVIRWPIRFVDAKDMRVIQSPVEASDGQTLSDIMQKMNISTPNGIKVHGVDIGPSIPLKDWVPSLIYPDGFLYVTLL